MGYKAFAWLEKWVALWAELGTSLTFSGTLHKVLAFPKKSDMLKNPNSFEDLEVFESPKYTKICMSLCIINQIYLV
jgi:hypothetical protein